MPYQVLIVEDDETLRETLEYNLRNQGYEVLVADNGYTALELARSRQPALMLLDLMLPGIDGFEAVSYTHLRAHETVLDLVCRLLLAHKNSPTSLIILSAYITTYNSSA